MSLTGTAADSLHTDCRHCGAAPERPCDCGGGVHYMRVARAHRLGWIDDAAFTEAIDAAVCFTAATVLNPAVTA